MARTMCKWKKGDIKKDFDAFRKIVSKPKFACGNCGRVAKSKKMLCNPTALDK